MPALCVFLGTKAQYIKTAPVLRRLDAMEIPYRLLDSGQHAALTSELRRELGVREPDALLGGAADVTTIAQAVRWSGRIATRLRSRRALRGQLFGPDAQVCVVHGDTPSTLLSTLLAKRAGLRVAHLEAGLRSRKLLHPFPEELIRLAVMRLSDVLFAPDDAAVANLLQLRLKGRIVRVGANTVVEAQQHSLRDAPQPGSGPAVITMHRVENVTSDARSGQLVDLACRLAARRPVDFVLHGPTTAAFARRGLDRRLQDAGVHTMPLQTHAAFTRLLAAAPLVITDGGSVQEECALLGVPTLLWRLSTERGDGLGANVLLSRYDPAVVEAFLAAPETYRRPRRTDLPTPSVRIVEELLALCAAPTDPRPQVEPRRAVRRARAARASR